MKSLVKWTLSLMLVAGCMAGCSDDDPASPGGGGGGGGGGGINTGTISFTLGGTNTTFTEATAAFSTAGQLMNVLGGSNPAQSGVSISMPNATGAVSVTLGSDNNFTLVSGGALYSAVNGEFTITVEATSGSNIRGTFSGNVSDILGAELAVANGQFDVDYIVIP